MGAGGLSALAPGGELAEQLNTESYGDHSAQDGQGDRQDRDDRVNRFRGDSAEGSRHSGLNGAGSC